MRKLFKVSLLSMFFVLTLISVKAQEEQEDSLLRVIEKLQSDVSILSKIKISGYIQSQIQIADTAGQNTMAGGAFGSDATSRFQIRRGRIKFAYTGNLSTYVLQFDASEGGFTLKDMYMKYTDPWINTFSLTSGIFNRNFGYEIEYSSSSMETPERSRLFQTLFPGEEDLGACLTIQPRKTSPFNVFKLDAGLFNGTGSTKKDFDKMKDFIGHLTFNKNTLNDKLKVGLGASYYKGGNMNSASNIVWKTDNGGYIKDSTKYSKREIFGVESQFTLLSPIGLSQLRAEYLWGTQPGVKGGSETPKELPTTDSYLRKFNGFYVIYSQNIMQSPFQVVARYDVYDPNTKISGKEIGSATFSKAGAGDIKYSTLGFGLIYRVDSNLKFTVYYDMVENEITSLSGYQRELKDNLLTLRLQYKF